MISVADQRHGVQPSRCFGGHSISPSIGMSPPEGGAPLARVTAADRPGPPCSPDRVVRPRGPIAGQGVRPEGRITRSGRVQRHRAQRPTWPRVGPAPPPGGAWQSRRPGNPGKTAMGELELAGGRSGISQRAVQRRAVYATDPTLGTPERACRPRPDGLCGVFKGVRIAPVHRESSRTTSLRQCRSKARSSGNPTCRVRVAILFGEGSAFGISMRRRRWPYDRVDRPRR